MLDSITDGPRHPDEDADYSENENELVRQLRVMIRHIARTNAFDKADLIKLLKCAALYIEAQEMKHELELQKQQWWYQQDQDEDFAEYQGEDR